MARQLRSASNRSKRQALGQVDFEGPIGVDVVVDQRGEGTEVLRGHAFEPPGLAEDLLEHQGVDVDQAGLEEVQGKRCEFRKLWQQNRKIFPETMAAPLLITQSAWSCQLSLLIFSIF